VARRRAVGDERAQPVAPGGGASIQTLDEALGPASPAREPDVPERVEQLDESRSARGDSPLRPDEVPGGEALGLGQRFEERCGGRVRQRQQPDATVPVGGGDGTRRETAEASAGVIEHDGPSEDLHGVIVPGPETSS
jgi:hypothetical protein